MAAESITTALRCYGWPGGMPGGRLPGIIGALPPPIGPGPASDSVSFWT